MKINKPTKRGQLSKGIFHTGLANSGRFSGTGIAEDYYGDEGATPGTDNLLTSRVRFPNGSEKPEDMNGEVIIVQKGRKSSE